MIEIGEHELETVRGGKRGRERHGPGDKQTEAEKKRVRGKGREGDERNG